MIAVVALAAALLAAVAVWGALRPFRPGAPSPPWAADDPLEEERRRLLASLRELEDERAEGILEDPDYRSLRAETEARAVSVLRAIEARDRTGEAAVALRALRPAQAPDRDGGPADGGATAPRGRGARSRLLVWVVAAAVLAGAVAPLLAAAVRGRAPGETITGESLTADPADGGGPLSFFEERVRRHPRDLAARLDLADRYLRAERVDDAIEQYVAALEIDPRSAEAHARLGFLLFRAGRPDEALAEVRRALRADPDYPEALYFKGVVLARGLDRPEAAARALRAYLEAGTFGAYREDARGLLAELDRG